MVPINVVLGAVVGLTAAWFMKSPKIRGPLFRMYASDSCHYCVEAKPEFLKLGSSQMLKDGKTPVKIELVNVAQESHPLAKKTGVPLFIYFDKHGHEQVYNGDRTVGAFMAFLQAV